VKSRREETKLFEELQHLGTPLDETVLRSSRAASQGLEISQTGCGAENLAHVPLAGGVGIMLSLCIENVSNRTVRLSAIRLKLPWFDPEFCWLKKQSPKVLDLWGGYQLLSFGTYGFDPTTVLNHQLTRNFTFYPGDAIEGFLLGEGPTPVPAEFSDRMLVPMQILFWEGNHESYGAWVKVGISRAKPSRVAEVPRRQRSPLFASRDVEFVEG
jgi:hypothetical protein